MWDILELCKLMGPCALEGDWEEAIQELTERGIKGADNV